MFQSIYYVSLDRSRAANDVVWMSMTLKREDVLIYFIFIFYLFIFIASYIA